MACELMPGTDADLSTDQMVAVVPYSSEVQQPMRGRLSWTGVRTCGGLHRETASRAAPVVCIQMVIPWPVPVACPMGDSRPVLDGY